MSKKRLVVFSIMFLVVTVVFASCALAQEGIVTLRFNHWFFGHGSGFEEWINGAVDEFEKNNPNIKIEREQVPYEQYWDKIDVALAAGKPPDVWACTSTNVSKYILTNQLLALDEYIDMNDFKQSIGSLQQSLVDLAPDRKIYCIAPYAGFYLPMYRPSIFKEAGIAEYAKTPEEFIDMVKKLTTGDRLGYAFMVTPGNWIEAYYDYVIWTIGLGGHCAKDGKPTLNSPEVISAMTYLKTLFDAGVIPKDVDKGTYRKMFAVGKVGTLIDGMWMHAMSVGWDPSCKDDFITADLPFPTQRVASFTEPIVASAVTKHPKESALLVEFMGSKEQQARIMEINQFLPVRTDVVDDTLRTKILEENPWYKSYLDHVNQMVMMEPPGVSGEKIPEFQKIWNTYMDKVLYEDMDVTEAMNKAQEKASTLLSQ